MAGRRPTTPNTGPTPRFTIQANSKIPDALNWTVNRLVSVMLKDDVESVVQQTKAPPLCQITAYWILLPADGTVPPFALTNQSEASNLYFWVATDAQVIEATDIAELEYPLPDVISFVKDPFDDRVEVAAFVAGV